MVILLYNSGFIDANFPPLQYLTLCFNSFGAPSYFFHLVKRTFYFSKEYNIAFDGPASFHDSSNTQQWSFGLWYNSFPGPICVITVSCSFSEQDSSSEKDDAAGVEGVNGVGRGRFSLRLDRSVRFSGGAAAARSNTVSSAGTFSSVRCCSGIGGLIACNGLFCTTGSSLWFGGRFTIGGGLIECSDRMVR